MSVGRAWMALLLAGLSLGCRDVAVKIATRIEPDGSFERQVTFKATAPSKADILARYELPSGRGWTAQETVTPLKSGDVEYLYEASGHFNGLQSDYAKRDEKRPPKLSRNLIHVAVVDNQCAYSETFQDTVDPDAAAEAYDRYLRDSTEAVMRHLAGGVMSQEPADTLQRIQRGVTIAMLGWQDHGRHLFTLIQNKDTERQATDWLNNQEAVGVRQINRWWKEQGSAYPNEPPLAQVAEAVSAWGAQPEAERITAAFMESIKQVEGAYDTMYEPKDPKRFEVEVEMPGPILRSNAHRVDRNRATWIFTPRYFWLKDYTLEAVGACRATPGQPAAPAELAPAAAIPSSTSPSPSAIAVPRRPRRG